MYRHSCSAAARFIRVRRDHARRAAGRVVLCSLVCAAIVMCATSARAEPSDNDNNRNVTRTVTNDQNFPFGDNDPCIGGALIVGSGGVANVSGLGHQRTVLIDRSKGLNVDITYMISQDGIGTSNVLNDPAEYRFASSGLQDTDFKSSTQKFTFIMTMREHIIREDQHFKDLPGFKKDDYFVESIEKLVSLNGVPVFSRSSAESTCK
jgi:hypothetical protein